MQEWPKDQQGRLSKVFTFKNYRKSFAVVSQVAMLAEKKNHHPEIILDYGKVTISLISHDVQQITERDLELATQIDKNYSARYLPRRKERGAAVGPKISTPSKCGFDRANARLASCRRCSSGAERISAASREKGGIAAA